MFGVPVEKHGQNSHLRQKGKIAELALGYGGSVGALKAMGALDMGLTEDELHTAGRKLFITSNTDAAMVVTNAHQCEMKKVGAPNAATPIMHRL